MQNIYELIHWCIAWTGTVCKRSHSTPYGWVHNPVRDINPWLGARWLPTFPLVLNIGVRPPGYWHPLAEIQKSIRRLVILHMRSSFAFVFDLNNCISFSWTNLQWSLFLDLIALDEPGQRELPLIMTLIMTLIWPLGDVFFIFIF